jgi:hypothetical protein
MIPFSLFTQYRNAIIAIALLGLLSVSHYKAYSLGKEREKSGWVASENKRLTDTAILILNNQKENTEKERKVSNAHQIELSAIRNRYEHSNQRLRYTTSDKCDSAGLPNTTAGTDATATRAVELPESITENLRRLARDADEVTATARGLQDIHKYVIQK